MREVLVAARGLSIAIDGHAVLDHVDVEVRAGELVSLIGPNGSGKTTLIRALIGLIPIGAGEIERARDLAIGYVPQRLVVDGALPMSALRFLGLTRSLGAARLRTALEEVGIGHVARRPVQALSGGEFQRLLLARALLGEPRLLVLDEPAQGIDVAGQAELYRQIAEVRRRRGCGVLLVSHDLHLVMAATDTVICLNRHVCCTGRPESVANDPAYLALFGPTAAASLAFYAHRHDHEHDLEGHVRREHGGAC